MQTSTHVWHLDAGSVAVVSEGMDADGTCCRRSFEIPRECRQTVGPADISNDFVIAIIRRAVRQLRRTASV